jgi:hypothetical protein
LKSFGFIDTCGIFNLHGIPGIIAFFCGVIAISSYDSDLKNLPFALDSNEVRPFISECSFPLTVVLVVSAPKIWRFSNCSVLHAGKLFFEYSEVVKLTIF